MALAKKRNIAIAHIQPGKSAQNAYIERFDSTVRHECLGCFKFDTVKQAQDYATRSRWTYNPDLPDMATGVITPRQKLKMAA
ncbi:transposase [Rhizobium skierniewicense]|nr:transposase [Rhizobium skierniewicense]